MTRIEQAATAVAAAQAAFADAVALESAPEAEIAELLTQTAALARLVQAQQVRLAGAIDARSLGSPETDLCRKLGKASAKEAVAAAFGIRAREAQELLSMARSTARGVSMTGGDIEIKYPSVATALDAGELSLSQARAIVRTLEPAAPRADLEQLAWAERCLVDAALNPEQPLAPELLVDQARLFAAVIDPDGVLPNGERQQAMRSLKLWQRPDGMWPVEGLFTPEAGSELKAMFDALNGPRVRVRFRDDADSVEQQEPVDDRSPEQRRHDAFLGIVRAQAASGKAPIAGGEVPRLVFNVTEEAYEAYRRGLEHPDRTLQIEHTGALVPIETVDRLMCDALVQRAVVDARGAVLDLGRTKRDFNRAQRRALAAQYGGCANCRAPASWCEAHHVLWWVRGGPTDLKNGMLLCSHCHHEVHAGRLVVVGEPGDWRVVAQLRPPDRYVRGVRGDQRPGIAAAPGIGALARVAVQRGALASAMRGTEPVVADAGRSQSPAGTGMLASDAAPSLAIRIRDAAPSRTRDAAPIRIPDAAPSRARRPRTSAGVIEQRLRRRLRDCQRPGPPRLAVDHRPPIPVVLRH